MTQESPKTVNRRSKSDNSQIERRTHILIAARNVLIEDGYPAFTMRKIATRAGIHLKTLQHYFKTRRELLLETVNHTVNVIYAVQFEQIWEINKNYKDDALRKTLEYLINDAKNENSGKFFFDLWALAMREEDAALALDALYVRHRHELEQLIARSNPRLSLAKVKLRATVIASQIEGLMLFIGHGKPRHAEFEGLEREVLEHLVSYAKAR